MSILNFIIMVVLLIAVIVLLIAAIIYLNITFYKEQKIYRSKLEVLQNIIVEISKTQLGQRNQIQLSEELEQSIKASNALLSRDIFGLHYEMFEILSKNNLLKK